MNNQMKLFVEFVTGEVREVPIPPFTQVSFEREYKMAIAHMGDDPKLEYQYWMAWHALTAGRPGPKVTFDTWLETITGLTTDPNGEQEEENESDPLARTASSGESFQPPSNPVPE